MVKKIKNGGYIVETVLPEPRKKVRDSHMKRWIFWLGLLLIISLFLSCAVNVLYFGNPQTRDRRLELWLIGFGSFGSFGAVVTALYLEPIKKFFYKPNLVLYVSNMPPLCVIGNIDAGSSENEEFVDICCKIANAGGASVEKCRISCEEILTSGADQKFAVSDENRFRPLFFSWIGVGKEIIETDIAGSDYAYFKLAEIRTNSSELGKDPDSVSSAGTSHPYLVVCLPSRTVKSQYIRFNEDNSIIIHLRITGIGVKTKERYIQIVKEGKTISEYKTHPEKLAVLDVTDDIKNFIRK